MAVFDAYFQAPTVLYSTAENFVFDAVLSPLAFTPDLVPPSIHSILPAPPGPLVPAQAITFMLTDNSGEFGLREFWVRFGDVHTYDHVHDGTQFLGLYAGSSITTITNGFSFSLLRAGGWPSGVRVRLRATVIDRSGNLVVVSA